MFKAMKEENLPKVRVGNTLLYKAVIQIAEIKIFTDNQKLKEFSTTKSAL